MKKLLLLSLTLMSWLALKAQDTAMDWTRTECGSTDQHHLFAELDSGYVIIIDFVMMACAPCVTASTALETIVGEYELSNPGIVRFYSVGFNNSTTCPQMIAWRTANGFKHQIFEKGAAETTYYGGMGMPTIVILGGGTEHKVYYNNFGYSPSDDPAIEAAIDEAISESSVSGTKDIKEGDVLLALSPNPFTESLTINLPDQPVTHVVLTDLSGREYNKQKIEGSGADNQFVIQTSELAPGIWFVTLYNGDVRMGVAKVIRK